jgi:hypothetical protein
LKKIRPFQFHFLKPFQYFHYICSENIETVSKNETEMVLFSSNCLSSNETLQKQK